MSTFEQYLNKNKEAVNLLNKKSISSDNYNPIYGVSYVDLIELVKKNNHLLAYINGVLLKLYMTLKIYPKSLINEIRIQHMLCFQIKLLKNLKQSSSTYYTNTLGIKISTQELEKITKLFSDDIPLGVEWNYDKHNNQQYYGAIVHIYHDDVVLILEKDNLKTPNIDIITTGNYNANRVENLVELSNDVGYLNLINSNIIIILFRKYLFDKDGCSSIMKDDLNGHINNSITTQNITYYVILIFLYTMKNNGIEKETFRSVVKGIRLMRILSQHQINDVGKIYEKDYSEIIYLTHNNNLEIVGIITSDAFVKQSCLIFKKFYYALLHNDISYI